MKPTEVTFSPAGEKADASCSDNSHIVNSQIVLNPQFVNKNNKIKKDRTYFISTSIPPNFSARNVYRKAVIAPPINPEIASAIV